jgi:hypothetical protein
LLCQLAIPYLLLENEVDGEAFLLNDAQIKSMVKAIGAQMKLIKKRDALNNSKHDVVSSKQ